ncbi:hypothetical protein [Micromonospora coerulea]|uniref:hypothetical protein n=1 Tax=Micromonospora coerulea TaxID=47856 RepID=UPI00190687E3|nr:hypothetical protein [Micromonospora veneta]
MRCPLTFTEGQREREQEQHADADEPAHAEPAEDRRCLDSLGEDLAGLSPQTTSKVSSTWPESGHLCLEVVKAAVKRLNADREWARQTRFDQDGEVRPLHLAPMPS